MLWKDLVWKPTIPEKEGKGDTDWYADVPLGNGTWLQVYKNPKRTDYSLFHDADQYEHHSESPCPEEINEWNNISPLEVMCIIHELRNKFGD
jgi:hypothetical protein